MLELHELSRIGFGCYRIARHSREHYTALSYALRNGCNLIDTAVTYTDGESERLIGEVLADQPDHHPFIITKAGYVQGESRALLDELNRVGRATEELVRLPGDSLHSIHPDFLDSQLTLSCDRLKRPRLDGFLIHNPEYYFDQVDQPASPDEYYRRIQKAFEFLEEQVALGRVRYYGVSSNALPFPAVHEKGTSLPRLLALADEVSTSHHFKLIQFPFNLIENDAQKPDHEGGRSLIDIARAGGIVTLINRPLNANSANGPVRLAAYEEEVRGLDEARDGQVLEECLGLVRQRLDEVGIVDDVTEFVPLQVISASWSSFTSTDMANQVFDRHVWPFLDQLYEGSIDEATVNAFTKLKQLVILYARRSMTRQARALRQRLIEQGLIAPHDTRPLPLIACQSYLNAGIDHVLVGMRTPKYVDGLRSIF
jgi:aryl-alcohol dehydrogenase-like predicted oxidoreductase